MPLDPLKFKIALDKASLKTDLTNTRTEIENSLNPVKIRLKITNLDEIKNKLDSIGADTSKGPAKKVEDTTKEMRKMEKEIDKAKTKLAEIDVLLGKMGKAQGKAGALGVDTTQLQAQIAALEAYKKTLNEIISGTKTTTDLSKEIGGYGATKKTATGELQALEKAIREKEKADKEAAREAERHAKAMDKAAKDAMKLTEEEKRLAQAIQKTISEMSHQSQVLTDLKSMAMQYLSVYAGQQFLNNIIEIGGQLEMQRLSIGAILQDTAQATDLFDRIKALALQSPFGVVELDQFTKQLSAYGFQYNELYDMTKRLADISAGAGTDVSRLALALGHVRAEGALTGYTLRQFAMNNIPMLGELSKKLTEIEHKQITAAEVRKRVRNKEIDYNMVEGVIKDLTNEGGMFYNMQEVISGSVKAKWKNLRDAFDVMYGEMAESSVGGGLKDVATALTNMAKQWKELGTVVMAVAGVYGGMKAIMMVYNTLLGTQARAVFATVAAENKAKISNLELATSYRTLSATERATLALGRQMTVQQLTMAINTKKLTMEGLARAVALGKVKQATALAAIEDAKLAAAQKATWSTAIGSVRTYGMLTGVINGTAMAFSRLGMALKALVMNPMTWIFAAITVITDLWAKNNQEMERAAELSKSVAERASEGIKNTRSMMADTGISYTKDGKPAIWGSDKGGKFEIPAASSMDGGAREQTMDTWIEYIKNYSALANTLLQNAMFDSEGKLVSITKQYEKLGKAVNQVALEQLALKQIADRTDFVLESTNTGMLWGALNDDIVSNMNDYGKAVRKTDSEISKFAMSHRKAMTATLNAAKADETFAKAIKKANDEMRERENRNLTEEEQLKKLATAYDDNGHYYEKAIERAMSYSRKNNDAKADASFMDVLSAGGKESIAKETMLGDMDQAAEAVKQVIKEAKWNIDSLEEYQKAALLRMVIDIVSKAGEVTEEQKEKIQEMFADKIGIPVDIDDVELANQMNEIEAQLHKLLDGPNGEGYYPIELRAVTDPMDFVQKTREAYKAAQDAITDLGPIAVHMGVSLDQIKTMTEAQIKQAAGGDPIAEMILTGLNQAFKKVASTQKIFDTYGFGPVDTKQRGKVYRPHKASSTKKTNKSGSKEDKEAKDWKERIRLLKDARQLYKDWENEIGPVAALEEVQEQFKSLVNPEEIATLEAYEKELDKVIAKAQARKNKRKGQDEHADEVIRQAEDEKAQIKLLKFQEKSEKFTADMDRNMESLTRQWEIFNTVLETTGDKMLAIQMSGLNGDELASNTHSMADSLRTTLDNAMATASWGNEIIDFNKIYNMSDKEIDQYVKGVLGKSEYAGMIDSIVDGLKEWKKLSKEIIKQDVMGYANLIGSAVNYNAQLKKNNEAFEDRRKMLRALLDLGLIGQGQYDSAVAMAMAERDDKNSRLSAEYDILMNNANSMSRGEILDAIDNAVMHLDERMQHGLITAEEYANELSKLKGISIEWEKNGFFGEKGALGSFVTGGNTGLINYYKGQFEKYNRRAAEARDKYGENSPEAQEAVKNADKYDRLRKSLEKLTDGADDIVAAFQSLEGGLKLVHDLFDAFGMESEARVIGDASDIVGGALGGASSMAGFGTYGMIAGAALGFLTSTAQVHDKHRQQTLDDIKAEVERMNSTLSMIKDLRQRELGYDTGNVRREMAEQYESYKNLGEQGEHFAKKMLGWRLYKYYSEGNDEETGYATELALLKREREELERSFDLESDKKKPSDAALEEYVEKIAEVEMKIKNFSRDIAKELWSIDLKSWADQLSDALMNAFENGTSAAQAFRDATRSILQNVVSQMMKMTVIEPMLKILQGKIDSVFNPEDPKASMGAVLTVLGEFFGEGGQGKAMMTGASEFFNGANELLRKNFGIDLLDSSQATQTSGIQSMATEESIGIVSGQMARIAQDVSVKRIFMTQIATDQMPRMLESAQMQQTLLETQMQSVLAIENMMSNGSGAMYDSIDKMSRKIDRAITPDGRMRVE